MSAECPMCR